MRGRLRFLDIARVLSVFLVAYGHFVSVGGYETALPDIVGEGVKLPLYDCQRCALDEFEFQLILNLHTQTAVLGVSMFFLITGFLIPAMLDRYTRVDFLINRVFRIFPALIVSVFAVGAIVYLLHGVRFGWPSYLASISLTYFYAHQAPVIGVLWTLVVEMLFYFAAALAGRFTLIKILALQAAIALVVGAAALTRHEAAALFADQVKFIAMILVGSLLYVADRDRWGVIRSTLALAEGVVASWLIFKLYALGHADPRNYGNLSNHLAALAVILALYLTRRFQSDGPWLAPVFWMSERVYPIYLVHAAVGLSVMGSLKALTDDPLVLIVGATLSSLAVAALIHRWIEAPGIAFGRRAMLRAAAPARVDRAAAVV